MKMPGRKKRIAKHKRLRRTKPKNWCVVYALREGEGGPVRYVGQTRQLPDERLRWHLKEVVRLLTNGQTLSPVQRWIASRLPTLPVLEIVDQEGTWDLAEAVWIDRFTQAGHELLNVLGRVGKGRVHV